MTNNKRYEQLDILDLDTYLVSLLRIESLFLYFPVSIIQPYLLPFLRNSLLPAIPIILQSLGGNTPGCKVLGIQIEQQSHHQQSQQHRQQWSKKILKLVRYYLISFLLPDLYRFAKNRWLLRRAARQQQQQRNLGQSSQEEQHQQQSLAQQRQHEVLKKFFQTVDTIIPILRLGVLLSCWSSGTTPNLGLVLSGLRYSDSNNNNNNNTQQPLQVLFAHRRWLHQEAIRLLPMLVNPISNSIKEILEMLTAVVVDHPLLFYSNRLRYLQRKLRQYFRKAVMRGGTIGENAEDDLSVQPQSSSCPICHEDPISIPYQIDDCGHIYCYTCLWLYVHRQQQRKQHHQDGSITNSNTVTTTDCYCKVCHTKITKSTLYAAPSTKSDRNETE